MRRYPLVLLVAVLGALLLSGLAPYDRTTWWLEVFPILIGVPLLVATHRRFPFTHLAYTLLAVHAVILMVGGHYSYARVPLGAWAQQAFGLARNDYDRLGHFARRSRVRSPARSGRADRNRCGRDPAADVAVAPGPLAVRAGHGRLPGDQRLLRVHRMVGRRGRWLLRGSVPRD